jgi:hypothetical protein
MKFRWLLISLILATITLGGSLSAESIEKLYLVGKNLDLYGGAEVLVYSLDRGRIMKRVPIGVGADRIEVNAEGSEFWVYSSATGHCEVLNTTSDEVTDKLEFGAQIRALCFTPDGTLALAAGPSVRQPSGSTVQKYDYRERRLIDSYELPAQVSDLVVSADSRFLYYADEAGHQVGRVALADFSREGAQFVGFAPRQLVPNSGRYDLFVVCAGLEGGARGGGQLMVLDAAHMLPRKLFDGLGAGPTSLALNEDASRAVLTFNATGSSLDHNIALFELDFLASELRLKREQAWLLGSQPTAGAFNASGNLWFGIDRLDSKLLTIDLEAGRQTPMASLTERFQTSDLKVLSLNVDRRLADLLNVSENSSPTDRAQGLFAAAYLQLCAGRENDVVATCQRLVDNHPGSREAVEARLYLAEIAAANRLHSKAAEHNQQALLQYRNLLEDESFSDPLRANLLLPALSQLAAFDSQFENETIKSVASAFLKLEDRARGSARLFFELGRYLHTQDQTKSAKKCFSAAREAMAADPSGSDEILATQLTLALAEKGTRYEIEKRGDKIVLDGNLDDWKKVKPLSFSGPDEILFGRFDWLGEADLSAEIYLTRSKESLLLAGRIVDATAITGTEDRRDQVNFYFDLRASALDPFSREAGTGTGCFTATVNAPTANMAKASVQLSQAAPFQIASSTTDSGYVFELLLPLTWFGRYEPREKDDFGLGIEIVDIDSDLVDAPITGMGFLRPRTSPLAAPQPRLYGVGRFK